MERARNKLGREEAEPKRQFCLLGWSDMWQFASLNKKTLVCGLEAGDRVQVIRVI